jgi:nucleotide sugar dehydrogenase
MKIGFIGQGFIGKNYADDFEKRGFDVVRYSMEEPYIQNKEKITECDIVFIAVPTPTTPDGFDDTIVRNVIKLVGKGKVAVVKSTVLPGSMEDIEKDNPEIFVLNSPEFLREATAAYDAANPERNIIGIPKETPEYREKAEMVMKVLAKASYELICTSKEAEIIKYAGNCFLFTKVIFMNILHDLTTKTGGKWDVVADALVHDSRVGESHMQPVHDSGRGAGGHCFIKDFAAFANLYDNLVGDMEGKAVLRAMEAKNIELLVSTGKNLDLLKGVYGERIK